MSCLAASPGSDTHFRVDDSPTPHRIIGIYEKEDAAGPVLRTCSRRSTGKANHPSRHAWTLPGPTGSGFSSFPIKDDFLDIG
jgi:hypothetical protein